MFRTLTTWLLAACLGTIASVGHGLHLLEGCGHETAAPTACCAAHCPFAAARGDHGKAGARRHQAGGDHDCLICRVLAQQPTKAGAAAAVDAGSVAEFRPAQPPARRAGQPARSHSPRAPPALRQA